MVAGITILSLLLVISGGFGLYFYFRFTERRANAPAIVVIDRDSVILSWDKQAERIFHWRAREVVGRRLWIIMPKRYQDAHMRGIARFLTTGDSRILGRKMNIKALARGRRTISICMLVVADVHGEEPRFVAHIWREKDCEDTPGLWLD